MLPRLYTPFRHPLSESGISGRDLDLLSQRCAAPAAPAGIHAACHMPACTPGGRQVPSSRRRPSVQVPAINVRGGSPTSRPTTTPGGLEHPRKKFAPHASYRATYRRLQPNHPVPGHPPVRRGAGSTGGHPVTPLMHRTPWLARWRSGAGHRSDRSDTAPHTQAGSMREGDPDDADDVRHGELARPGQPARPSHRASPRDRHTLKEATSAKSIGKGSTRWARGGGGMAWSRPSLHLTPPPERAR